MNANENRIYSLAQAAVLTGFSAGKFRYNKPTLIAAGVTVSDSGWRIPHTALARIGWLDVKPPRGVVAPPSPREVAELRVQELEAEVARLLAELGDRPAKKRRLFAR